MPTPLTVSDPLNRYHFEIPHGPMLIRKMKKKTFITLNDKYAD